MDDPLQTSKISTGKIGQNRQSRFGPRLSMTRREAAAGLHLAGNDPTRGRSPDLGAPRRPRPAEPRTGNIDSPFDDFSPPEAVAAPSVGNVHAFQLVKVADDDLCVRQGTIGSETPTLSGSPLEADHTENSLSLPGTGTREYWLQVNIDASGDISSVTIQNDPGSTTDSATVAWLKLGSVETNSGDIESFNSNLSGSQALASCGSTHYFGLV